MNDFSGLLNSDYGFNLSNKSAPMSSSSKLPIFDLGYASPSSRSTRTFNSFDCYHVQGLNIKGFRSPSRGGTIGRSIFGFWKRSSTLVSESSRDEIRIEDQGSTARVRPNRSSSKLRRASFLRERERERERDCYHVQGLNIKGFRSPSRGGTIGRSIFRFWKRSSTLVSESSRDEIRIEDQGSTARVRPNRSPSKLRRASLL